MNEAFQSDYKLRGARWGGYSKVPEFFEGAEILETGCGNGKTLKCLPENAVGIDISQEAVKLAGPRAIKADIRCLPFNDESFDFVLCFHVLGHLLYNDRITAASEMHRVLKHGGKLYFKAFSPEDFRFGKGDEIEEASFLRGDGIMTHYFTEDEVKSLLGSYDALCNITYSRWSLSVKGIRYPRCEICAEFLKK